MEARHEGWEAKGKIYRDALTGVEGAAVSCLEDQWSRGQRKRIWRQEFRKSRHCSHVIRVECLARKEEDLLSPTEKSCSFQPEPEKEAFGSGFLVEIWGKCCMIGREESSSYGQKGLWEQTLYLQGTVLSGRILMQKKNPLRGFQHPFSF